MKRYIITLVCVLLALIIFTASTESPISVYAQGGGEPRFSYPGAGRFELTSYMDHTNPNYTVDDDLTIYTTERGLENNGCADISLCYWSGGIQVCGYYTESMCGGRQIWYDGHPAIDYGFPMNTPVAAAAAGTSYRYTYSSSQAYAVVADHGSGYLSKYLHVDRDTRISNNTSHNRGTQIALSSDSGTGLAHLHFETRYNGEWGTILDPYGWQGDWQTDPWNGPLYHTNDWWRSNAPIPMGYRDQNHDVVGPYELYGAIGDRWEYLDGQPGSPISGEYYSGTGIRRDFEKGYISYWNNSTTYYPYSSIALPDVRDEGWENGWVSDIIARNDWYSSAQISSLYTDPDGRVIDSRTQASTPADGTWSIAADDIFDTEPAWGVADTFAGSATVYHEDAAAVIVESTHADATLASAYTGIKSPAITAYLPAFYKAPPNLDSRFSVLNTSADATTVSMSYYEEDGTALGTHNHILSGGGQYTFDPYICNDVPANVCAASFKDGGVVLSASQPIAVTAETTWYTGGLPGRASQYSAAPVGRTELYGPSIFRVLTNGSWTMFSAVRLQNLSSTTATVNLTFTHRPANTSCTTDLSFTDYIPANSSHGYNTRSGGYVYNQFNPNLFNVLGDCWDGTVSVSSNQPLVGVVNTIWVAVNRAGTYSLLGPEDAESVVVLPKQIYSNGSRSAVNAMNVSSSPVTVQTHYYDAEGDLVYGPVKSTLQSKQAIGINTGDLSNFPDSFNGSAVVSTSSDAHAIIAIGNLIYTSADREGDRAVTYEGVGQ